MAIERHPLYLARLPDWILLSDCYEGERHVKERGDVYLPATAGMIANGYGKYTATGEPNLGQKAYDAYRTRAVFPEKVSEAVVSLAGNMHRKPMQIENLPKVLEPLVERATIEGEPLSVLARKITEAQLLKGRCALLVDVPTGASVKDALPYFCFYDAAALINWDPGIRLNGRQMMELAVLNESDHERVDGLRWEVMSQYRVCMLSEAVGSIGAVDQSAGQGGKYVVAVARQRGEAQSIDIAALEFVMPTIGGRPLEEIPIVIIGATDLCAAPGMPPLLGLANTCMAIYRGEADYRQTLFMQGQDSLVVIGQTEEQAATTRTGAGAIIDVGMGGDAKYIGVSSTGLPEQRAALENDRCQADAYATQVMERKGNAESGEALRVRVTARTATLVQIQLTMAQGIKDALTLAGKWLGVGEAELKKIEVKPNLDFAEEEVDPQALDTLMSAKQKGLPLSGKSLHCWLKKHEYTTLEYEEEIKLIAEEQATMGTMGGTDDDLDPFAKDEDKKKPGENPFDDENEEPDDDEEDAA